MESTEQDNARSGDELRGALLAQRRPAEDRLEAYKKEVAMMLDNNELGLKRERKWVAVMWIYLVLLCTGFMVIGGLKPDKPIGTWFACLAIFWFLFGAVELLKHFINRARVEVLKEVKKVELEVMELREALKGR